MNRTTPVLILFVLFLAACSTSAPLPDASSATEFVGAPNDGAPDSPEPFGFYVDHQVPELLLGFRDPNAAIEILGTRDDAGLPLQASKLRLRKPHAELTMDEFGRIVSITADGVGETRLSWTADDEVEVSIFDADGHQLGASHTVVTNSVPARDLSTAKQNLRSQTTGFPITIQAQRCGVPADAFNAELTVLPYKRKFTASAMDEIGRFRVVVPRALVFPAETEEVCQRLARILRKICNTTKTSLKAICLAVSATAAGDPVPGDEVIITALCRMGSRAISLACKGTELPEDSGVDVDVLNPDETTPLEIELCRSVGIELTKITPSYSVSAEMTSAWLPRLTREVVSSEPQRPWPDATEDHIVLNQERVLPEVIEMRPSPRKPKAGDGLLIWFDTICGDGAATLDLAVEVTGLPEHFQSQNVYESFPLPPSGTSIGQRISFALIADTTLHITATVSETANPANVYQIITDKIKIPWFHTYEGYKDPPWKMRPQQER